MKNKFILSLVSLLTSVALFTGSVSNTKAASASITVAAGVMTNFPLLVSGPVKISQVVLTSTGTNIASVQFIDTPTNALTFTNAAYTNITSYLTNYINNWTNYYGVVNSWTNISLVDITNSVAGTTNNYPVRMILATPTNSSTRVDNAVYSYLYTPWVTNTGTGSINVTINYSN